MSTGHASAICSTCFVEQLESKQFALLLGCTSHFLQVHFTGWRHSSHSLAALMTPSFDLVALVLQALPLFVCNVNSDARVESLRSHSSLCIRDGSFSLSLFFLISPLTSASNWHLSQFYFIIRSIKCSRE